MSRIRRITIAVEEWFRRSQRPLPWRETYDPYHVWVSEVMLQQTRMGVVLRYFSPFIERFPTIAALAKAPDHDVLAAWSGLGYYRRARMLRAGAADVVERFGGRLPRSVEELITVSGIGRYTAGAIASIAYGVRAPIVDGNVARILARLEGLEAAVGSSQLMRAAWKLEEDLVTSCNSPREFNQGLMEIGALVCKPSNPSCRMCPLRRHCVAFRTKRVDELPVGRATAASRSLTVRIYVITDRRGWVLMRRENAALMTSMFHLPHGDTLLFETSPLRVEPKQLLGAFRHTITNRRIEFRVYAAEVATGNIADSDSEYRWIDPADVNTLPHPSYVAKALKFVEG